MDKKQKNQKAPKKVIKKLIVFLVILIILAAAWITFSLIGRIEAGTLIPDSAAVRITVPNPARTFDRLMAHESLNNLSGVPELVSASRFFDSLKNEKLLENRFARFALKGRLELALLSKEADGSFAAAFDLKLLSPLLRIIPVASNFITIKNLYFVQAGRNSRFEYRWIQELPDDQTEQKTVFIGTHKNILFITDNPVVFESRLSLNSEVLPFNNISVSNYDASIRLSHQYINDLFSEQDPKIAAILENLEFDSTVEAGLSIFPRKIEFHLSAPVASNQSSLSRFLESRSQASGMNERLPGAVQYATILSAGSLQELFEAALVFMPDLQDTLRSANSASRFAFGLTIDDMLFSWTGKEYAVFGMEGRPHPVYAIQVADEKKRQEVFDKAFQSIVLSEDIRLNLDGTRIPRITVPGFVQAVLKLWNINLPSPYYTIYRDFVLVSESADTLLSALRAMQRNDVLPRTEIWQNIAGGRTASNMGARTAFSVYYSMDRSMPFFLRKNTAFSGYLSLYQQGLVRISFNAGIIDLSISLIPGQGSGVMLVGGYPLDLSDRVSNKIFGAGDRIYFTAGSTAYSMDIADNALYELQGQGGVSAGITWVMPNDNADGSTGVWVVNERGRVTLADGNMEPKDNFPVLTGLRISGAPAAYNGKIYIYDDEGAVYNIDDKGNRKKWETVFSVPLQSPPSFLTVPARGRTAESGYAAVYPKSFFGELFLLNPAEGKTLPDWPRPVRAAGSRQDEFAANIGISFGSPLVFLHENHVFVAFINQTGELILYDGNASVVPPFPLQLENIFYLQPVFDGTYLWLIAEDGTLYRISMEGEILSHKIPDFSVKEEGYITIFDYNGDNIPEVFITGEGNALYAFTRNFRSLEDFPLPVWGRPYFIAGKKAEIFGIGMDKKLYRWQFR